MNMRERDTLTEERLALAKDNIVHALVEADSFLNRPRHFPSEDHEEMRDDAMSFVATMKDCLEEAEKALE